VCGSLFLIPTLKSLNSAIYKYNMHYLLHNLFLIPYFLKHTTTMSDKVNGLPEDQAWQELKLPELLNTDAVREIHATIEKEWDFLQRSACQTAAGRALWKHAIHDPLADLLAGETYLRNLHEKIKNDRLNNAREISGVILAVRTLWFDSRLEDALNSPSGRAAQVVLLGAGLSTSAINLIVFLTAFLSN